MIYIVTAGEYSDYGIVAIFSTRELAQKFMDTCNQNWDEHRIEEWQIDKPENIK